MTQLSKYSDLTKAIALCRFAGVRPRLMEALITRYGSLERILHVDAGSLMAIAGLSADAANKIARAASFMDQAELFEQSLKDQSISMVSRFEPGFPPGLFELNDPPSLIYFRGRLPEDTQKRVTLTGTENSTIKGIELTVAAAQRFAEAKVQVVSSIAIGVSASAHLGTNAAGGASFAVLDTGVDIIDPEDHTALAIDIVKRGGLLSEHPPGTTAGKNAYIASNRIIAAISQAVVVTEFYDTSESTLDLLKCCSQIGKLAFILIDPRHGPLTDTASLNKAIGWGAIPFVGLEKIDDIVASLV